MPFLDSFSIKKLIFFIFFKYYRKFTKRIFFFPKNGFFRKIMKVSVIFFSKRTFFGSFLTNFLKSFQIIETVKLFSGTLFHYRCQIGMVSLLRNTEKTRNCFFLFVRLFNWYSRQFHLNLSFITKKYLQPLFLLFYRLSYLTDINSRIFQNNLPRFHLCKHFPQKAQTSIFLKKMYQIIFVLPFVL